MLYSLLLNIKYRELILILMYISNFKSNKTEYEVIKEDRLCVFEEARHIASLNNIIEYKNPNRNRGSISRVPGAGSGEPMAEKKNRKINILIHFHLWLNGKNKTRMRRNETFALDRNTRHATGTWE